MHSTTTLDGHDMTIVGVAPAALRFPAAAEFWQPLIFNPRDLAPAARGAQWVQVLARLKDTVSPGQATTALQTVADRLNRLSSRGTGGAGFCLDADCLSADRQS